MSHFITSVATIVLVTASLVGTVSAAQFRSSGFSDRAIIIVSGKGGMVSLNPQPLPPTDISIFSVFGKGGEVSLNPQPLPPRELGPKRAIRF